MIPGIIGGVFSLFFLWIANFFVPEGRYQALTAMIPSFFVLLFTFGDDIQVRWALLVAVSAVLSVDDLNSSDDGDGDPTALYLAMDAVVGVLKGMCKVNLI